MASTRKSLRIYNNGGNIGGKREDNEDLLLKHYINADFGELFFQISHSFSYLFPVFF